METEKTAKIMREIIKSIRLRELFYSRLSELRNKNLEVQREQMVAKKEPQPKVDKKTLENSEQLKKGDRQGNEHLKKTALQSKGEKTLSKDNKSDNPALKPEKKEETVKLEDKPDVRGYKLDFNA